MRRKIRIVYQRRKQTFLERLERDSRRMIRARPNETSIDQILNGDIALTLGHLDATRRFHAELQRKIVRKECYIGTEILALQPREPVYEDRYRGIRDMLRGRLLALAAESRRLEQVEHDRIQTLHDRLWQLVRTKTALS